MLQNADPTGEAKRTQIRQTWRHWKVSFCGWLLNRTCSDYRGFTLTPRLLICIRPLRCLLKVRATHRGWQLKVKATHHDHYLSHNPCNPRCHRGGSQLSARYVPLRPVDLYCKFSWIKPTYKRQHTVSSIIARQWTWSKTCCKHRFSERRLFLGIFTHQS